MKTNQSLVIYCMVYIIHDFILPKGSLSDENEQFSSDTNNQMGQHMSISINVRKASNKRQY